MNTLLVIIVAITISFSVAVITLALPIKAGLAFLFASLAIIAIVGAYRDRNKELDLSDL